MPWSASATWLEPAGPVSSNLSPREVPFLTDRRSPCVVVCQRSVVSLTASSRLVFTTTLLVFSAVLLGADCTIPTILVELVQRFFNLTSWTDPCRTTFT